MSGVNELYLNHDQKIFYFSHILSLLSIVLSKSLSMPSKPRIYTLKALWVKVFFEEFIWYIIP